MLTRAPGASLFELRLVRLIGVNAIRRYRPKLAWLRR